MRLAGAYPERNYVVQYNESDFAFVSRLLEIEGIAYYFRHDAGGHVMVLADSPEAFADLPGTHPYRPVTLLPAVGSILSWGKTQEIRSGKVTLWDHSFETPGDHHEAQATIQETVFAGPIEHHLAAGGGDSLEVFDYPGYYAQRFDGVAPGGEMRPGEVAKIDAEGRRVAATRIQEEATQALVVNGVSVAPDLAAGHLVTISGLSVPFNGRYLVSRVTHRLNQSSSLSGGYRNEFTCIPAGLPYRPPRVTPKPRMAGMETAVVVAPPGEEIFTDKYGRVKVKFHWDRTGRDEGGGSTSCWIRVASPWAGAGTGAGGGPLILPRVGWEVVVAFLHGDPDQPIIVGSVFNADHLPPPPER
jgi:type VI secretion system secreted protein VgrG